MRRFGRKWWNALPWMLLLCILAGCMMAVYAQRFDQPVYRAVYTLYAVPEGGAEDAAASRMLASDCAMLTRTDTFRSAVLENVRSDGETAVDVQAVLGTHMLEVSAVGPDPEIVQSLANAVGQALQERMARMFHARDVKEIARASLPQEAFGPTLQVRIAAAMLATLAIASLLALCLPEKKRCISASSPEAEAFSLGALSDTRALVKQFQKTCRKKGRNGMLLEMADFPLREEIRRLVLVMRNAMPAENGRSLVMTAMRPHEEEAALTVLLASEMAQQGFRVLLLDMDAQHPEISELLGVKARADLCDYFAGRAEIGEVIQPTMLETLSFVDSLHPASGVADVAAKESFAAFIRGAEAHFDFVLLRAASRAVSSDASMLGLVTSATLLIARDGRYTLQEIEAAARDMARLGKPARGVVFTRSRA